MRTTFISTISLQGAARGALPRLQQELAKANQEITTGRHADVGLTLGVRTGDSVSLRSEYATLDSLIDGNALATAQLDQAQSVLDNLTTDANSFIQDLLGIPAESTNASGLESGAKARLDALIGSLNATDGRRYLFGGTNSSEKPIADYDGAPKTAVDAAFLAYFGFDQSDPQVADIPAVNPDPPAPPVPNMQDFLDNEFADLFEDPAWGTDWSSASSTNRTSLVSSSERVQVSTNANETAMRNLAMAYTMVAELGTSSLNKVTLQTLMDKATEVVGAAINQVTNIGVQLGTAQARISASNEMMERAQDIAGSRLSTLEDVDPAEAKTRVDALTTQIQMSYSLTTQIMGLSILNYA